MMAAQRQQSVWRLSALVGDFATVSPEQDRAISALALDSRALEAGSLFLACTGQSAHGLDFVQQALDQGAAAIAYEPADSWPEARIAALSKDLPVPLLRIPGLGSEVSTIAARFYGEPSQKLRVIGVTGTNGKTSCSQFLAQALSDGLPCGVIGTLGNGFPGALKPGRHTTPEPVELQALLAELRTQGAQAVAMEVSSHALDQGRAKAVHFDTAVLTNLSRDHLDFHGSMENYARSKASLFQRTDLRCAVLNLDDPFSREILDVLPAKTKIIAYGLCEPEQPLASRIEAWAWAKAIRPNAQGMTVQLTTSWGQGEFSTRLLGRFNISNLLAVLAVLLDQDIPFPAALGRLEQIPGVVGRMEPFGGNDQPLVVVDYAHTPDALEQAILALRPHCAGRLWCVFGCGGQRDPGKRPLMGAIAEQLCDQVILTDDNPREEDGDKIIEAILGGTRQRGKIQTERNRAAAIRHAVAQAQPEDLVLICGKGHETTQQYAGLSLPFSDREQVQQALAQRGPA